ncbi:MAG: peptidase BlaR1, partial [Caulobacteraceae bacterium]|nr:peptidase BlaR1 [Caulobacteraceae bacterium]
GLVLALIACGSVIKLAGSLGRTLRLGKLLAHSRPCDSPELNALLRDAARQAAIRSPGLRLWAGGEPVLVGLRRPVILLPERLARDLAPERIGHVFAHELAHLQAHDHWRLPLLDALTSLFWFNPPMAACAARLMSAQEEACDARALSGADRRMRRAYAETLFNLLKAGAVAEPAVAFTGWRRSLAVRRLRAILNPAPVSPARARLAILAASLAVGGGVTGAGYALAATLPTSQAPSPPRQGGALAPAGTRPTAAASRPAAAAAAAAATQPGANSQSQAAAVDQAQLNSLDQDVRRTRDAADQAGLEMAQTVVDDAQNTYDDVRTRYAYGTATLDQLNTASTARVRALTDLANLKAQQAQSTRVLALGVQNTQPPATRLPTPPAASAAMIDTLTTALAQARIERIRQQTFINQVRTAKAETLPSLVKNSEIENGLYNIDRINRTGCGPAPAQCNKEADLAEMRDQIDRGVRTVIADLSVKLDLARAQESAIQAEIDRVRRGSN